MAMRRVDVIESTLQNTKRKGAVRRQLSVPPTFELTDEVRDALSTKRPVVALESTIISHGMPYPQNVQCALELEDIVRKQGAVPATIAILGGVVRVGLTREQLEYFGKNGRKCLKSSRRDLPYIIGKRLDGATTVATTILLASMVGIRVMATGGIGGVHRRGEVTMDVSADLTELGRTPVFVFCAGVKSILDIGRTLEVLETQGVLVAALGTDEFPAFFTRKSGHKAPLRVDSVDEIAAMMRAAELMKYKSGAIIGVPIPEAEEANANVVEDAIQLAVKETEEKKIEGRDVTPYILGRVNELTKGRSLASNLALVKNNTMVAAKAAVKFSELQRAATVSA